MGDYLTTPELLAGERIDQLYSQDIKIIQSPQVFSFSLDAVLLANFARSPAKRTGLMVDLCAGNGAVGLFMAPKTRGHIAMVELQPRLADMAKRSVTLNHLDEQVTVYQQDLATITDQIPKDSVDVVVCNPPYFADLPASKKNPNQYLAIARHEITTSLETVIRVTSGLLKMNGRAYFVHRPDRLLDLTTVMGRHRLAIKRLQFVYPKPGRDANIVLVEAIKDGQASGLKISPALMTYDESGEYSAPVKKMLYGE
ncbi:tRNA1(Val) (adenine(37)-N6)-methyltransferase [Secundilactobacillus folii]|uniref:Methyltransferase n=1 Tax=Secundilactobacillus folii TaxID=2678357 RepID=A0A7X3C284_9LACO|nr:tRNA1(Val) (adenine(37)-N6)-methyltransferase [Secundilactobacillus folii]MTV81301.1 methyltransferase [Secundilactobacillus folii]